MGSNVAGYDAAQLALIDRSFVTVFYEALESAATRYGAWIDMLAMTLQTPGVKVVQHNWTGPVPNLEEWTGSRPHSKLRAEGFTLANKKYATGVELDGDDVEDNTWRTFGPRIAQLPLGAIRSQWLMLVNLLNGGFTSTATYDGAAFFSSSHPNHGNTMSNYTNEALDSDALQGARTRLVSQQDEDGNPLNLQPTHLIVEPTNYFTAKALVEDERLASGATNPNRGLAKIFEMPGLTPGYWFLADFSLPVKPLILQNKRSIRPDRLASVDSPDVYDKDKFKFGVSWKGATGYSLWELIQGSDASE